MAKIVGTREIRILNGTDQQDSIYGDTAGTLTLTGFRSRIFGAAPTSSTGTAATTP